MSLPDYKTKYQELKSKFMTTVDLSFRLGYEQGMQSAQMDQVQQQQMQQDAMNQQMAGQPQPEQESSEAPASAEVPEAPESAPVSENPQGDELSQHIEKLESMIGKSEISSIEVEDLKKTLADIRSLQVQINLNKSMDSIKKIQMPHKRPALTITPKLRENLKEPAKQALSLQEEIVKNIFAKWEKDSVKTASDINSILNVEGLTKKE